MMILRYICLSLCLITGTGLRAQALPPSGAWRQAHVNWKKPPAELQLKQRYAEVAVLFFSPDQRLVLMYGTLIQAAASERMSNGDGRVVYLGTWKLIGNSLHLEYRLASRTVPKDGEKLPGPIQSEDIHFGGNTLLFQGSRFDRDKNLDDEFKTILQGESDRQGNLGKAADRR